MQILANEKCRVEYSLADKQISGTDHTDLYNGPAFYSISKRNLQKAWKVLESKFEDETTMHDCINILSEEKIICHSYCRMD